MMKKRNLILLLLLAFSFGVSDHAGPSLHLDGQDLSLLWGLPFIGILLSIALCPLFMANYWHHNYTLVLLPWNR